MPDPAAKSFVKSLTPQITVGKRATVTGLGLINDEPRSATGLVVRIRDCGGPWAIVYVEQADKSLVMVRV